MNAHLNALLWLRHEEIATAGAIKRRHDRLDAKPVGIRLDHGGAFGLVAHLAKASPIGDESAEIEAANDYCCGTMTVEGAPHLAPAHLPVFDQSMLVNSNLLIKEKK